MNFAVFSYTLSWPDPLFLGKKTALSNLPLFMHNCNVNCTFIYKLLKELIQLSSCCIVFNFDSANKMGLKGLKRVVLGFSSYLAKFLAY